MEKDKSDKASNTGDKNTRERFSPDRLPLTGMQAERLSKLTRVDAAKVRGRTVADLSEELKWHVEPHFFLYRRICGRVVKTDPATGIDRPVPRATVHVEDTDCSFLGLFPVESPFVWFFPIFCRREVIATTMTDECGRFCVWVPRFDVDWILRFRRERYCYFDVLAKPSIKDLLERLTPHVHEELPPVPDPGPDPSPIASLRKRGITFEEVQAVVGREPARMLRAAETVSSFGAQTKRGLEVLDRPAFPNPIPPPVPERLRDLQREFKPQQTARMLGVPSERLEQVKALDFRNYIGPFLRCRDVLVPEIVPILDVPDITFRVTQDVNGDGTEETIYSENFFDVRWNEGAIPDVTLHASQIAIASLTCDVPDVGACGQPQIVTAGLMPLHNSAVPGIEPYHDSATGYAKRPNRPHPATGLPGEAPPAQAIATAPFTGTLQLYGCNERPGASFYRVLYSFRPPGGASDSAPVPFLNLGWPLWRWVGSPGHLETMAVSSDAAGWYPIIPFSQGWLPSRLLLNWPTGQSGRYRVQLQFADASRTIIPGSETTPIGIFVDNDPLSALISEIRWRTVGGSWSAPLPRVCPVVFRPAGQNIEFRVNYSGSALHLLSVGIGGSGCGGGNPLRKVSPDWSEPASTTNPYEHWYMNEFDNSVSRTAIFRLPGATPQGAYDFTLTVNSRAFNPAGGDGGFEADWNYNAVVRYVHDTWKLAIIDA